MSMKPQDIMVALRTDKFNPLTYLWGLYGSSHHQYMLNHSYSLALGSLMYTYLPLSFLGILESPNPTTYLYQYNNRSSAHDQGVNTDYIEVTVRKSVISPGGVGGYLVPFPNDKGVFYRTRG